MKTPKGFTGISLIFTMFLFLFGFFGFTKNVAYQSTASLSSDTLRLKQVEAVRNAMSDFYTRYNITPAIASSGSSVIYVVASDSSKGVTTRFPVEATQDYRFISLKSSSCTSHSYEKVIYFYINSDSLVYCKAGSGEIPLRYK